MTEGSRALAVSFAALAALGVSGCSSTHSVDAPEPADVTDDDVGTDACRQMVNACGGDPNLSVPVHGTFDGARVQLVRAELFTSVAFSVFHRILLIPPTSDCAAPRVEFTASPTPPWTDAHQLGPREAVVLVGPQGGPPSYSTMGRMDVVAFDDTTGAWEGRLFVEDARLQLDVEITTQRCADVSGP
ncbi:MAG: hypothetical protein J0L92_26740 [Deltaproteobacteria bacterium]|nr:hypothetical protein [Deltaproteobacteria bacterium]